jgi:hypothetical protein
LKFLKNAFSSITQICAFAGSIKAPAKAQSRELLTVLAAYFSRL